MSSGAHPQSNRAFIADGAGSTLGGLLGSSALTTYVESAAAVREGGRTGLTAVVCSLFFFARCLCTSHARPVHDPDLARGCILIFGYPGTRGI